MYIATALLKLINSPSVSSGIVVSSLALETSCSEGDGGGVGEVEAGEETAGRVVSVCDESVRQQSII